MAAYHDTEWGAPIHDDTQLFELLTLEGAQAGLSWHTILQRRQGYRALFAQFNVAKVAQLDQPYLDALRTNPKIIRNRLKIQATVSNARATLKVIEQEGSLDEFLWSFVDGKAIHNTFESQDEIPSITEESIAMSQALRRRGFTFVGPTICYALMQSAGLVNDHLVKCFRYEELRG